MLLVELKDAVATGLDIQLSVATFMDNPSIVSLAEILLPMVWERTARPRTQRTHRARRHAVVEFGGAG
jgi:hypothetical protein